MEEEPDPRRSPVLGPDILGGDSFRLILTGSVPRVPKRGHRAGVMQRERAHRI